MDTEDLTLIGRKILVGLIVAALPLLIVIAGLYITRLALEK